MMAAIWFSLSFGAFITAMGARTWRGWFVYMALAFLFGSLFLNSSPLLRNWWFGS